MNKKPVKFPKNENYKTLKTKFKDCNDHLKAKTTYVPIVL